MARITVEDCLDNVENRFELVMLATKRARQIATGGKDPLVKEDSDKATVISLREIAEGLVTPALMDSAAELEEEEEFEMGAFEEEALGEEPAPEADAEQTEAEAQAESEEGTEEE